MSVVRPVGPEEPQTYWARRAAVLVVLVLLAALIAWLVIGSRGGTQAAPPADSPEPQTSAPTTPGTGDTPSAEASGTASPTSTASPSSSADSDQKESDQKGADKKKDKDSKDADKKKDVGPKACAPDTVRTTLTGAKSVKAKEKQDYALSLINGSKEDCVLTLDADHFELRIYSGTDRIWSSADCAKTLKATEKKLKPEQAHEWKMAWNGARSAEKCTVDNGTIRPGTYVATAQFKGAEPTQHVFTIKG